MLRAISLISGFVQVMFSLLLSEKVNGKTDYTRPDGGAQEKNERPGSC